MRDLVHLLAELHPDADRARMFADRAGIPVHTLLPGTAEDAWASVVREARRHRRLFRLCRIATQYYQREAPALLRAAREYRRAFKVLRDQRDERLRSSRPESELSETHHPDDFLRRGSDDEPQSIGRLLRAFKSQSRRAIAIVTHFSGDLIPALLEAEEALCTRAARRRQSIWIRWDEATLLSAGAPGLEGPLSCIYGQLAAPGTEISEFKKEFRRILDGPGKLFVLAFEHSRSPQESPSDEAQRAGQAMYDALVQFSQLVSMSNHLVVFAVPRRWLRDPRWQTYIENDCVSFSAASLFDDRRRSSAFGSAGGLPELLRSAILPMLNANSVSLRHRAAALVEQLAVSAAVGSSARQAQLAVGLGIASQLEEEDFIEPAYRLERCCVQNEMRFQPDLDADVYSAIQPQEVSAIGYLGDLQDIPKLAERSVLRGPQGAGKTTVLRRIDEYWSVPRPWISGRRHPVWVPVMLGSSPSGQPGIRPPISSAQANLPAHSRLAGADLADLKWLLSSPPLLLIDEPVAARSGNNLTDPINRLNKGPRASLGIVLSLSDGAEPPSEDWYGECFASGVEIRLRPLSLTAAIQRSPGPKHEALVRRLFMRIDEPLESHVRNPLVLQCLTELPAPEAIPTGASLLEVLDQLIEHLLTRADLRIQPDDLRWHLRQYAAAEMLGAKPTLAKEPRLAARRAGLITSDDPPEFAHVLFKDFFLSDYLADEDSKQGWTTFKTLLSPPSSGWESRFGYTVRLLFKRVGAQALDELIVLMEQQNPEFVHSCVLELTDPEIDQTTRAEKVRVELVRRAEADVPQEKWKARKVIRQKEMAARALGRRDPRAQQDRTLGTAFAPLLLGSANDSVPGVRIGKYPVTNAEYLRFLDDDGYDQKSWWSEVAWLWRKRNRVDAPEFWGNPDFCRPNTPVVGVSLHEAAAYARWLTARASGGNGSGVVRFSLPSSVEWALGAGIADLAETFNAQLSKDDIGDDVDLNTRVSRLLDQNQPILRELRNNSSQLFGIGNTPIGLFAPVSSGAFDMLGNVWEWCDEWAAASEDNGNPSQPSAGALVPVRIHGGPVHSPARAFVSLIGSGLDSFSRVSNVGFRLCVRSGGDKGATVLLPSSQLFTTLLDENPHDDYDE